MDKQKLFNIVTQLAKGMENAGCTVEINKSLSYVAIELTDYGSYFMQGGEAQEFLDTEVQPLIDLLDGEISEEQAILYLANSW